jgi:hypothetical protein
MQYLFKCSISLVGLVFLLVAALPPAAAEVTSGRDVGNGG